MEGINPTLTFLALILGLSGNARDAADNQVAEIERHTSCPLPMIVAAPSKHEAWGDAFWKDAASASVLPDVIEPKWADSADPQITADEAAGDVPTLDQGSDSIRRRTVPTSTDTLALAAEPVPCAPER
ncbi:hypothetical protein [Dongia deserti]|uniref:hypothetical protein n=1 Tax=Dongia deserti TaxID=2268030 RepID=UPI0013C4A484|nr:hypothetical protein [Dongia deserti]